MFFEIVICGVGNVPERGQIEGLKILTHLYYIIWFHRSREGQISSKDLMGVRIPLGLQKSKKSVFSVLTERLFILNINTRS